MPSHIMNQTKLTQRMKANNKISSNTVRDNEINKAKFFADVKNSLKRQNLKRQDPCYNEIVGYRRRTTMKGKRSVTLPSFNLPSIEY